MLIEDVTPFIIIQEEEIQKAIKAYYFDCNSWYDIPECYESGALRKTIERASDKYDKKRDDL